MKKTILSLLVVVGLFDSAYSAVLTGDITNSLVGEYLLGNNADDTSIGGNNGASYNVISGIGPYNNPNGSYIFQGEPNTSYVEIPNNNSLYFPNNFSITLDFKFNSEWNYNVQSLVRKFDGNNGFNIFVNQDSGGYGLGKYAIGFQFIRDDRNNDDVFMVCDYNFISSWNSIAAIYNSQSSSISLFINGDLKSEKTIATPFNNNNANVIIAGSQSGEFGEYIISKEIANVRFFDTVLSNNQIQQLVIPEPSTYALFGIVAVGMLMVMRRKKAA